MTKAKGKRMNPKSDSPPISSPPVRAASMGSIPPFAPDASFRFDPKVNVLIGPNGVGKSIALKTIAGERQERIAGVSDDDDSDWILPTVELIDNIEEVATVFVGATRASLTPEMALQDLRLQDTLGKLASAINAARLVFLASSLGLLFPLVVVTALSVLQEQPPRWALIILEDYLILGGLAVGLNFASLIALRLRRSPFVLRLIPGNRLLSEASRHNSEISSIFMFQAVASINRRLLGVRDRINRGRRSMVAQEAAGVALECAKAIAPEVFPTSAELRSGTIVGAESSTSGWSMSLRQRWLRVRWKWYFTDHLSIVDTRVGQRPLHITSLSAGTQGTLLIAWYLALSLAYAHEFKEGWRERPAVLFIDEIENHLHPTWQRRFIPVFLEQFPNLQIFATTHSPFTIAGLKAGQVHKLTEEGGKTKVATNKYDIIGWTADEILHEYLGVFDPTDLETAQAAEILRWLEELEDLSDEGPAECWREETVSELDSLIRDQMASVEDEIVARWLGGDIVSPIAVCPPLDGNADTWREAMVNELHSLVGVDILVGGPAARQRKLRETQIAEETL